MNINRKLITPEEQTAAVAIMMHFREIHHDIGKLEKEMERIREEKEMLLMDLDVTRADDEMLQAQLLMEYGPGALDATKLEWVTKIEEHEHAEDNN